MPWIDRNTTLRAQRHAKSALRPFVNISLGLHFTEKHVTRVAIEQIVQLRRILLPRPSLNALHRSLLKLKLASVNQDASNRLIGMAILIGITNAHQRLPSGNLTRPEP